MCNAWKLNSSAHIFSYWSWYYSMFGCCGWAAFPCLSSSPTVSPAHTPSLIFKTLQWPHFAYFLGPEVPEWSGPFLSLWIHFLPLVFKFRRLQPQCLSVLQMYSSLLFWPLFFAWRITPHCQTFTLASISFLHPPVYTSFANIIFQFQIFSPLTLPRTVQLVAQELIFIWKIWS